MSKALSKHSNIRKSGNSLVVTIPYDVVRTLELNDGDSVFWNIDENGIRLDITKLETIMARKLELKEEIGGE